MKKKNYGIVCGMFYILPLLDSLNGYLIRNRGITIGPIYHFLYGVILLTIGLNIKKEIINIKTGKMFLLFLVSFLPAIMLNNLFDAAAIFDYSRAIKALTTCIYFISFLEITRKDNGIGRKIFDYTTIVIPSILIVLRITGLGYNYYSGGKSGYVGWYSSLDELNVILTILLLYSFITFRTENILHYFRLIIISVCMILLSSKASFLILILVFSYYFIYSLIKLIRNSKIKPRTIILLSGLIIASICVVIPVARKISVTFLSRQRYLFKRSEGVLSYFTSGRIDKMDDLIISPLNKISDKPFLFFVRILFGNGFMHYKYYGFDGEYQFEMEMFDSYFWMGLLGIITYLGFFVYCFCKMKKTQTSFHKYIAFGLLFSMSFLIGHILYAGVASIYFCLFFAVLCNNDLMQAGIINENSIRNNYIKLHSVGRND